MELKFALFAYKKRFLKFLANSVLRRGNFAY